MAMVLCRPALAADLGEPVVPRPEMSVPRPGRVTLGADTPIEYGSLEARAEADMLATELRPATGFVFAVRPIPPRGRRTGTAIEMELDAALLPALGEEGYRLVVPEDGRVRIVAATAAGLFYGGQTLRQSLPPAAFAQSAQAGVKWELPCGVIEDRPRHPWRGFMLDYARHFFGVEYTKHLLDEMAARKMNVFHMHLTDDDGWRIEIKKYPKLTGVGAWRGDKCALPSLRQNEKTDCYGGFFTQDQIREIVAYAAARHIEVLPEIDLPGHALALVTAYPETLPSVLSDARNDNGFGNNLLSPAKEANFGMIDGIFAEVAALFPFGYVHIGGDEVDYWFWDNCPQIQALVRREKLAGTQDMQGYFTRQVEKILARHGKKMVGWNEITGDHVSREALIMSWTGGAAARDARRLGFSVVAAHSPELSPDMLYPHPGDEPPVPGFAGPVSFQRGLEFDPAAGTEAGLSGQAGRIRGVEGCLWAEYITPWNSQTGWINLKTHEDAADFKVFPRLCALADVGWAGDRPAGANAEAFLSPIADRLPAELARLRAAGVVYRPPTPDVARRQNALFITAPCPGAVVRYTLDGTDPLNSPAAVVWDGAPVKASAVRFAARAFVDGVPGPLCFGARSQVVARWEPAILSPKWHTREVDLTGRLDAPGDWRLHFKRLNGRHELEVGHVDLLVNGKLAAQDDGGPRCELGVEIPIGRGDKVVARIDIRTDCGNEEPDSFGYILLDQADGPEPEMSVSTAIPAASGEYAADNLADFDHHSYFWSNRPAKKGETVVWTFDEPEELIHVECVTGVPNALARDQLADGILEISNDGQTFRRVAMFTHGAAAADFPKQGVKAVRLMVTEDQSKAWLAVQGLILR